MPFGHLYIFFGEMSFEIGSFFFFFELLILSSIHCFYILKINSLSFSLFTNMFTHSIGCLVFVVVVFIVPFAMQKLLSFTRSHLLFLLLFPLL